MLNVFRKRLNLIIWLLFFILFLLYLLKLSLIFNKKIGWLIYLLDTFIFFYHVNHKLINTIFSTMCCTCTYNCSDIVNILLIFNYILHIRYVRIICQLTELIIAFNGIQNDILSVTAYSMLAHNVHSVKEYILDETRLTLGGCNTINQKFDSNINWTWLFICLWFI